MDHGGRFAHRRRSKSAHVPLSLLSSFCVSYVTKISISTLLEGWIIPRWGT